MRSRFLGIGKKFTAGSTLLSMVALLLLLAPAPPCEAARRSREPSLDTKRLLRAYTPHKRGSERMIDDLTWSPDRRHAYYTITEKPDTEHGETWETLFAVRRNGTHIRRLYSYQHPGEHNPSDADWSPDSSRIVMSIENFSPASSVNADGIQLIDVNPETQELRKLSRDLGGKPGTGSILDRPDYYSFSPNGKYLLLTLGGDRQDLTNKRLIRIDYATGKRKLLTPFGMTALYAHWSRGSRHIVYIAMPDSGRIDYPPNTDQEANYERRIRQRHLYIMDADGGRKRRLAPNAGYFEEKPAWVAGGRKISFERVQVTKEKPRSLWTVRPDGTGLTRVRTLPSE